RACCRCQLTKTSSSCAIASGLPQVFVDGLARGGDEPPISRSMPPLSSAVISITTIEARAQTVVANQRCRALAWRLPGARRPGITSNLRIVTCPGLAPDRGRLPGRPLVKLPQTRRLQLDPTDGPRVRPGCRLSA